MSVLISKEGFLTTLQDLGRLGFRRFGINPNGAMDKSAVRLINILLGNDENEAVLEMHFPAPEIVFEKEAIFALGGAEFGAKLDNENIENWRIYSAERGSVLKFTQKTFGNRAYLSVKNGFSAEKWLNSASTNLKAQIGGFHGRVLKKGDRIFFNSNLSIRNFKADYRISRSLIPFYSKFPTVRIIENAEFDLLTALSQEVFLKEAFVILSDSDRMGFRLSGKPLFLLHEKELVSSAVNFGTIQLLPEGQLIVLMADHQTSGGYPRLATVIPTDIPLLAQLGTNDKVAFHLVSLETAEDLLWEYEKDLNLLRVGCKFKN
jgi:antagonist of KipI